MIERADLNPGHLGPDLWFKACESEYSPVKQLDSEVKKLSVSLLNPAPCLIKDFLNMYKKNITYIANKMEIDPCSAAEWWPIFVHHVRTLGPGGRQEKNRAILQR